MLKDPDKRPPRTLDQLGCSSDGTKRRFGLAGLIITANVLGIVLALVLSSQNPLSTVSYILILSGFLSPLIALLFIALFPARATGKNYSRKLSPFEDD